MQNLLEKSICKITGTIQNWIEKIAFERTYCHMCKREMTEEELKTCAQWPSGDSSVPVCDDCKNEIIHNWWEYYESRQCPYWRKRRGNKNN